MESVVLSSADAASFREWATFDSRSITPRD
jgi:hypothetical protein